MAGRSSLRAHSACSSLADAIGDADASFFVDPVHSEINISSSREEGGTGLGLAIVRHQVEVHGGSVTAESELQHGTTVRCWFPAGNERETMA